MQGDHEELKIFLQSRLISTRFNQELGLQKKNIGFNKKFHPKNYGLSNSLEDDSTAEIERFKWAMIPRFSSFLKRNSIHKMRKMPKISK